MNLYKVETSNIYIDYEEKEPYFNKEDIGFNSDLAEPTFPSRIDNRYVMISSCFMYPSIIKEVIEKGFDVIGIAKTSTEKYYLSSNKLVRLKKMYRLAQPETKKFLCSICCILSNGIPVKIFFIQNPNKKGEWLALLSTDCT